jgi:cytochrome c5
MHRITAAVLLAIAAVAGVARCVSAQKEEPVDPRILAYDKGPAKIDVSKYPADMQSKYKVFAKKCSNCHTIARPINCDYVLEDEWERYIKRMMRKAGPSLISVDEGKQIFDFLVFDSKTRKKDMYQKRLAEGPKS